jgi:hypothetical protein
MWKTKVQKKEKRRKLTLLPPKLLFGLEHSWGLQALPYFADRTISSRFLRAG